jgi:hypothetical protein
VTARSPARTLLLVGLGLAALWVVAVPLWVRLRLPEHATPAAVEAAFEPQLLRLREMALDFDHATQLSMSERVELQRGLFGAPAILEAGVVRTYDGLSYGAYPVKLRDSPEGDWRFLNVHPTGEGATVTPVHTKDGLCFEYHAKVEDAEGRMRGYTLLVTDAGLRERQRGEGAPSGR